MGALQDLLDTSKTKGDMLGRVQRPQTASPLRQLVETPIDSPDLSPLQSLIKQGSPSPLISQTEEQAANWERKRWEDTHPFEVEQFNKAKEKQLIDLYLIDHPEDKELQTKFEAGEKPSRARIPLLPELGLVKGDYREILLAKAQDWNYGKLEEMGAVPSRRKYTNLFTETGYAIGRFATGSAGGLLKFAGQVFDNVGWLYGPDARKDKLNILERSGQAMDKVGDWFYEKELKLAPSTGGGLKAMTVNATASALSYTLSLLALKGAGSPALLNTMGLAFINDGQQLYKNAKLNGATEEQAQLERLIGTTIVGTIEGLQLGQVIKFGDATGRVSMQAVIEAAKVGTYKRIKESGKQLSTNLLHQFISQGTEEAVEQAGIVITPVIHGQPPTPAQALTEIGTAFLAGGIAGTAISLPYSVVNAVRTGRPSAFRQALVIVYARESGRVSKSVMELNKGIESDKPATKEQSRLAHSLAEIGGLKDSDYIKLAKQVTGKESTKDMTGNEAALFINELAYPPMVRRLGLNTEEEQFMAERVKDKSSRIRTMAYFDEQAGRMPENPQMRQDYSNMFKLLVLSEQKAEVQRIEKKLTGKNPDTLSEFLSARYVFGNLEIQNKIPFRRRFSNLVANKRVADLMWTNEGQKIYTELGGSPFKLATNSTEDFKIKEWLDEEQPIKKDWLFSQMSKKVQSLALKFNERFQGKVANLDRKARWLAYRVFGRDLSADLTTLPPDIQKAIIAEGIEWEKAGKLDEWIATQTWGTRPNYFPHIGEMDNFVDSIIPSQDILRKKTRTEIQQVPREAMTRKGKSEMVGGSVMSTFINHASRLQMFCDSAQQMKDFWKDFSSTKPTFNDQKIINAYFNVLMGRRSITKSGKILSNLSNLFWKFYFVSPLRGLYFSLRNVIQNVAFLNTQLNYVEMAKSIYSLTNQITNGKHDAERLEDYAENWDKRINEKTVISKEFMFQEYDDVFRKRSGYIGSRLFALEWLARKLGDISIESDAANRNIAWNLIYDANKRIVGQYRAGQLDWRGLSRVLNLQNLHPSEQLELMGLLNRGRFREFVNQSAEYRTENIHFRYDTALRAPMELEPTEKALWGLVTYPRGVLEISFQQGIMPLFKGLQTGNFSMAKVGLMTISKQLLGMYFSDELLYLITGKHSYSMASTILGWSPLAPGIGTVYEFIKDLSENQYKYENDQTTFRQMLDGSIGSVVNGLAWMVALDTVQNFWESAKGQRGRSTYRTLKRIYYDFFTDKFGKQFDYQDRTMWQAFSHFLFGGFERVEPEFEPVMPEEKK